MCGGAALTGVYKMHHDFFNGDADGICTLHQLRLQNPIESRLVTGVKRDIALLEKVDPSQVSSATVLDISYHKNRQAVDCYLQHNIGIQYFDHHYAGKINPSPQLEAHINTHAQMCTGLIVNHYLRGAFLPWAVVAAFGDNLHASATKAARPLALSQQQLQKLEALGTLVNYNSYGAHVDDLFFDPQVLYQKIKSYTNPFDFIENDNAYRRLQQGYASDLALAEQLPPTESRDTGTIIILPEEKWSRRISGVLGNQLARHYPNRAHALLSPLATGGYLVSVRAPLNKRQGADVLCRQFETGGGRQAAAGINYLPTDELQRFSALFYEQFAW